MESYASDAKQHLNYLAVPGVLVTTSWLATHLGDEDLRILDVRQPALYTKGHLPGARNAPLEQFACTRDGVEGMLLPSELFEEHMSRLGVRRDTPVVVYDDTWGMAAARLFWGLEYYGHRNVAVLNGGWDIWRAEGFPVETGAAEFLQSAFTAQPDPDRIATYTWLHRRLDHDKGNTGDLVVVDTRSAAEYDRGHLPGAIPWDWMNATAPGSWEALRDGAELSAELEKIGITHDKEIVVYCRSGVRAAHTYLVLRSLEYPRVRNYDGSWLEWEVRAVGSSQSARIQSAQTRSA